MITFRAFDYTRDYPFVEDLITLCEDTTGIIAERDGNPVAAVICDNWTNTAVQVHILVKDPLVFKHGLHREVCKYVFLDAGRKMMIGLVPANNKKALKLDKHSGFYEVTRIEDGYDEGIDYVVMRLDKHNCKYLTPEERSGKIEEAA